MKAIELTETGGPEIMCMREIPTPTPRQDEVLIRVAVTGVNLYLTGMSSMTLRQWVQENRSSLLG